MVQLLIYLFVCFLDDLDFDKMQKEVKAKRQQYLFQQPGRNRLQQVMSDEWPMIYVSSQFLENHTGEICSHLTKPASKSRVSGPINSKITLTNEQERIKERARRKKGGEEKKSKIAFLVFIIATFDIFLSEKKTVGSKRYI